MIIKQGLNYCFVHIIEVKHMDVPRGNIDFVVGELSSIHQEAFKQDLSHPTRDGRRAEMKTKRKEEAKQNKYSSIYEFKGF